MIIRMEVKLERYGKYLPAISTNGHPESWGSLAVVVIDGERQVHRPRQVYCLRISDSEMAELARSSAYPVVRDGSVHEKSIRRR